KKARRFWRGVLCCFDRLMVRFDSDREHFLSLGVPEEKIFVTGDCKIDAMFSRRRNIDASKWEYLRGGETDRSNRPLFLAASTHPGEEGIVLGAFRTVRQKYPKARLILVPRHPERARSVASDALAFGGVALLSDMPPDGDAETPDIVVVDKIGVLFDLCSIADAAFVGGSLVPKGGQNLMEPALFGIQVTHGPDTSNFPDALRMDSVGAAQVVRNAPQLAKAWLVSMNEAARLRARQACQSWFDTVGGASARSWRIIREYINLDRPTDEKPR
ncbi:MAG: 3-deoxy-D-manno-octulosonic acid transferase, partial [Synergistaceae bacterium]|nr:3-deoxy-D-manno-octulosonic acid transferase [Synergistaceae bacterium]